MIGAHSKKLAILIADDDQGDRKQLRRVILKTGLPFDIEEAEEMEAAVDFCDRRDFDFLFLDYQMPGNERFEGLRLLHDRYPYLSIVVMTGQGDEEIASKAMKLGASDYIPKRSLSSESLRRIIEHSSQRVNLLKEMDQQRESLEQFSHSLAHDLASPIRVINAICEEVNDSVQNKNYEELVTLCDFISRSAHRMSDLITALQAYNQASLAQVHFESVYMHQVIEEALENIRWEIQEKNALITYENIPTLCGHKPQLIQLMQNMIGNGVKYCDALKPEVHISSEQTDGSICICVADNGIGIEERFQEKIFAPFQRLHPAGDKKYSGTGLGLSTCKKIVERHGGEIWCRSERGMGTKFFFTLPNSDE